MSKRNSRIFLRLVCTLAVIVGVSTSAQASEEEKEAEYPLHHLALFAGAGAETEPGHGTESGHAVGLVYRVRLYKRWGVGVALELLGNDTLRNQVVAVPASYYPGGEWRIFAGPGVEFGQEDDEFLFRVGGGYEFSLGKGWSLSPELLVDFIESGARTWLGGLAFGYEF